MLIGLKGKGQSDISISLINTIEGVDPGGHVTLFFEAKSKTVFSDTLTAQLQMPEGWHLLSQRLPASTAGQQTVKYLYVMGTPPIAPAGEVSVSFKILEKGIQTASKEVKITIKEIQKVDIYVVSKPEFIREGEELKVEYMLQNSGNKRESLKLKTTKGLIQSDPDSLILEPNTTAKVVVIQKIPVTENNSWQATSDLSAEIRGLSGQVFETISIPVFSTKIKKTDPYQRLPVEVGGGYMVYQYGRQRIGAYQYSVTGKGYFDEKQKHFVDFTVRGPNQFLFPAVGSYDQYSFNYVYKKKTFATVGDYFLQFNNLMELARFGRGASFGQEFRKLSVFAFYQNARFFPNQKQSFGGRVLYKIGSSSNIAVNFASKNVFYHQQFFWSNLAGVSGLIKSKNLYLETELAGSNALGKNDFGGFSRFQYTKRWVNLSGTLLYAGKNFYGYYNNSVLLNGNLGFNITQNLSVGLNGNFSNVNPSLDVTMYSTSPKDENYSLFASYQAGKHNQFSVFYAIREREDRQKPSQFHFKERFGNISYTLSTEKVMVLYQGRYGYSQNLQVPDRSGLRESYSNLVQPTVRIFPWIWAGLYAEHQHTSKYSLDNTIQDLFYYGGNLRMAIASILNVNVMYRNNYAPDELFERRTYMDASILLDLKRHKFSLHCGRAYIPNSINSAQNTLFFTLRYALKLNIPISKKHNIGIVKGQVLGAGFKKEGTLIQLGNYKFLTDSTGSFHFNGLAPDRYYLSMTQNQETATGVVPTVKMPMSIDVKADSVRIVNIPLTKTGGISGTVKFASTDAQGMTGLSNQKPIVLIKLYNDTENFLTELNNENGFSFKEIKPGEWNLLAFIAGGEDRFIIENANQIIHIEADMTKNTHFEVKPNGKRIHFSGKSFQLSIQK